MQKSRSSSKVPPEFAREKKKLPVPPAPTPGVSLKEAIRTIDLLIADPWYKDQMPVTRVALASLVGGSRALRMRNILHSNGQCLQKIAKLIPDIEARNIVFTPEPPQRVKMKELPPYAIWITPPETAPRMPKISPISAWTIFSRCASCDGNKWIPAEMGGKEHVLCYPCLPPSQYPALGAKKINRRLIHEAIKKYYS